jgi:LPXTG-motif cell wall-anchored protein
VLGVALTRPVQTSATAPSRTALARTGRSVQPLVVLGLASILLGATTLVARRRVGASA